MTPPLNRLAVRFADRGDGVPGLFPKGGINRRWLPTRAPKVQGSKAEINSSERHGSRMYLSTSLWRSNGNENRMTVQGGMFATLLPSESENE